MNNSWRALLTTILWPLLEWDRASTDHERPWCSINLNMQDLPLSWYTDEGICMHAQTYAWHQSSCGMLARCWI